MIEAFVFSALDGWKNEGGRVSRAVAREGMTAEGWQQYKDMVQRRYAAYDAD